MGSDWLGRSSAPAHLWEARGWTGGAADKAPDGYWGVWRGLRVGGRVAGSLGESGIPGARGSGWERSVNGEGSPRAPAAAIPPRLLGLSPGGHGVCQGPGPRRRPRPGKPRRGAIWGGGWGGGAKRLGEPPFRRPPRPGSWFRPRRSRPLSGRLSPPRRAGPAPSRQTLGSAHAGPAPLLALPRPPRRRRPRAPFETWRGLVRGWC